MSTKATVATIFPDDTIKEIYIHYDGYPDSGGVGDVLKNSILITTTYES